MTKQVVVLLLLMILTAVPCHSQSSLVSPHATHKQTADDRAIALLMQRKEIKAWITELDAARKTDRNAGNAAFTVDHHKGNVYTVHVFENRADHTATFNWYDVDIKSGKVDAQF